MVSLSQIGVRVRYAVFLFPYHYLEIGLELHLQGGRCVNHDGIVNETRDVFNNGSWHR